MILNMILNNIMILNHTISHQVKELSIKLINYLFFKLV